MKFEDDAPDILHSSIEKFLYSIVEYNVRIIQKIIRSVGNGVNDESYFISESFINSIHGDMFIVFDAIM